MDRLGRQELNPPGGTVPCNTLMTTECVANGGAWHGSPPSIEHQNKRVCSHLIGTPDNSLDQVF